MHWGEGGRMPDKVLPPSPPRLGRVRVSEPCSLMSCRKWITVAKSRACGICVTVLVRGFAITASDARVTSSNQLATAPICFALVASERRASTESCSPNGRLGASFARNVAANLNASVLRPWRRPMPEFVKGTSWASQAMSDKQTEHFYRILGIGPAEGAGLKGTKGQPAVRVSLDVQSLEQRAPEEYRRLACPRASRPRNGATCGPSQCTRAAASHDRTDCASH